MEGLRRAPLISSHAFRHAPRAMTKQPFFAKHGRVVIGLLAHVIEEHHGSDEFVPAPLTVDMFWLPNIQTPVEITTGLVRDGKRIKVVEAGFFSGGTSIARASRSASAGSMTRKARSAPQR
jgi:hypothetical protein